MRIIGGKRRGLKLVPVGAGDAAAHLRPTSDRVREAVFNILINGPYGNVVENARVLDLFAGTGALGLEALSRGAAHATFVDDGITARALLRRNIDLMQATGVTNVWRRDATDLGPVHGAAYSLVFLDPPYGCNMVQKALSACLAGHWFTPGAVIVCEENAEVDPPYPLERLDLRRYGDTVISLMRYTGTDFAESEV